MIVDYFLARLNEYQFALILTHLEAGNHPHQVLQLERLEVWYHRGIGVGSVVFSVSTCTNYTHYNVIYLFFILWILFLSVVETLVILFRWMIRCNIYKI